MFKRFGIDATHPTYAYELTLWLVQLLGGLYVLTPWFVPEANPYVVLALGTLIAIKVYGTILAVIGGVGLFSMYSQTWKRRYKMRRICLFASCLLFLFFCILRIVVNGLGQISWTSFFLNAVGAAIIYFRIGIDYPDARR